MKNAFTLIELIVVLAIMAIISVYTLANYSSFGDDQNLKNAVLDVQSLLRQAQTNASSNVKCDQKAGAVWQAVFSSDAVTATTNLSCQDPLPSPSPSPSPTPTSKKVKQLGPNLIILNPSGNGSSCPSSLPFIISFAPLSGQINLGGANCTSLTITVKNIKTNKTLDLYIDQGGRIYGQ